MISIGIRSGMLLVFTILISLVLLGCSMPLMGLPTATPSATPTPPAELSALPRQARIRFIANNPNMDWVNLWEQPGLDPHPQASDQKQSNRGQIIDSLRGCTSVTVTNFAWSKTDQKFYVYIKADSGLDGWVALSFIKFDLNARCTDPSEKSVGLGLSPTPQTNAN